MDDDAAAPAARPDVDDDRPAARERWLRLALLTVAAALAGTIFSLYSQRSDDDPVAAANQTEGVRSGTVTVDIDVLTGGDGESAQVVNRYDGDDFATVVTFLGDPEAYSGSALVQELRFVDGQYFYRSGELEGWTPVSSTGAIVVDEGFTLPASVVGWRAAGLSELVDALDLPADPGDGAPITGTITVGEARALAALPIGVEAIVGESWEWRDDQPVTVAVTLTDGRVTRLDAAAADESADRPSGPLSISTMTAYADLDADLAIEVP